jgi:hypothetical protein
MYTCSSTTTASRVQPTKYAFLSSAQNGTVKFFVSLYNKVQRNGQWKSYQETLGRKHQGQNAIVKQGAQSCNRMKRKVLKTKNKKMESFRIICLCGGNGSSTVHTGTSFSKHSLLRSYCLFLCHPTTSLFSPSSTNFWRFLFTSKEMTSVRTTITSMTQPTRSCWRFIVWWYNSVMYSPLTDILGNKTGNGCLSAQCTASKHFSYSSGYPLIQHLLKERKEPHHCLIFVLLICSLDFC